MNYILIPGLPEIKQQPETEKTITLDLIMECVSKTCNISKKRMCIKSRKTEIVMARHLFSLLARELTDLPLKTVGYCLRKHHTTIMHSVQTYNDVMDKDAYYRNLYDQAKRLIV